MPKEHLLGAVENVMSDNTDLQIEATTQLRNILSHCDSRISQVIEAGVVPKFVEFLDRFDVPQLQLEAAWILTNIASGTPDETNVVIDLGAVPKLVKLLTSPNNDLCDQAIWALGNIGSSDRDVVLRHGILPPLLQMLNEPTTTIRLRNGAWALSNLYRSKPHPEFNVVRQALPTLARLVNSNDEEVLADTCSSLSHLSEGNESRIQAILDLGVTPRIVELLMHQSIHVQTPALRIIGNIALGNDSQTQTIINACVLPRMLALLSHTNRNIRKESACAVSNVTINGTLVQIQFLVQCGCIRSLCDLLVAREIRTLNCTSRGIENILRAGDEIRLQNHLEVNPYIEQVRLAEGLSKLEALQNHTDNEIRNRAQSILETCNNRGDLNDSDSNKNTSDN
eukprot:c13129_g1_i2.p1 GENE.c13129_g1_i2~~c13129_g1_i2.p1  ORF type:complete len:396 (-),score=98.63 c13129_g1_i2:157-1344(-)